MQDTLTLTYTDTSKIAFIDGNGNLTTITYAALLDSLNVPNVTGPDSTIAYYDSNGELTGDSVHLVWTGTILKIKNAQYGFNAGAVNITASTMSDSHIMHRVSNDGSSQMPSYRFIRSRGTLAAPTPVIQGSIIGRLSYSGYNGIDFTSASLGGGNYGMEGIAAGTWAADVQPMYIRISTSGWSQNVHPFIFTPAGTFSIGSGAVFTDTSHTLSVRGTARIMITPRNYDLEDSATIKDDSTGEIRAWIPAKLFAQKGDTNTFLALNTGTVTSTGSFLAGSSAFFGWSGRGRITAASDGVFLMRNGALNDFGRLQFGGTTSSFPSIKRNGTGLQTRLADDSGYAPLETGNATINSVLTLTPITATAASALTPTLGMLVVVSNTNGTFTSIGLWFYNGSAWTFIA